MAEEKSKAQRTISIREFKMWLQGVEEMQDEGWTPTATQWKRIREKIELINNDGQTPVVTSPVWAATPPARPTDQPRPPAVPAGPSALEGAGQPTLAPRTASGMPTSMAAVSGTAVKTADIDTSNGNYKPAYV